jgi:hypothetical protein
MLINWNFVILGWIFKLQQKLKLGKERFHKNRRSKVYPDTTVWIKDFAYSYNEPMHNDYFWRRLSCCRSKMDKAFVLGEH